MLFGLELDNYAITIALVASCLNWVFLCWAIAIDPSEHHKGHWTTKDIFEYRPKDKGASK